MSLFPDSLAPWLADPRVPDADALRARLLARYLRGTELLETRVVNPVLDDIHSGRVPLSDAARARARELYDEEVAHANDAADLARSLGLPDVGDWRPSYFDLVDTLDTMERFLFVVVTETVVSMPLLALSRDPSVHPAVRTHARDHARDEARHARFFALCLAALWPDMQGMGPLLPEWCARFLTPDVDAARADLVAQGLSVEVADDVLAAPIDVVRRGARPMLRHFDQIGVLEHPETFLAFTRAGLI